jgi:hypothetical protein
MNAKRMLAAGLLASAIAFPASAQQMKTVNGVVINMGIINAIMAEHADSQHGTHKGGHGAGMEHVVVVLAAEKGGARIGDADVTVEVKNPRGTLQKKALMPMLTAGYPDYSEVFDFGWSGHYTMTVLVKRKGAPGLVEARFDLNRAQ